MKITNDHKEIITSIALGLIDAYKIWMACLLSVFVPQYCPDSGSTCSLRENFVDLNSYNIFVLCFNFFTLLVFKYSFYIQNKREYYIITHLDVDNSKPTDSLEDNLRIYTKIGNNIRYYNQKCYNIIICTSIIFFINTIISTVLVCYYYYDGFRTVTTLIANILLVSTNLYSSYDILKKCSGERLTALSIFREEPVNYNVIDTDYVIVNTK